MQKKLQPRTLKGFRDVLPAEAMVKTKMLRSLVSVFESFGFAPIETPHLEFTELLIGETSEDEVGKQLYRFEDNGGRDVCMRFDLTVPFARYVVQHKNDLGIPFKRYAIGNVFRGEQPQLGRYREFTQCDFDIVGVPSGSADAEIVQVIAASLKALGIENFTIRVSNRKIMNGLALSLGVPETAIAELLRIIDKIDKIGSDGVADQLQKVLDLNEETIKEILDFVAIESDAPMGLLEKISSYKDKHPLLAEGIEELSVLATILTALDTTKESFKIDLSIARGLGYYTGIVYETVLNDMPEIGSVCSGGRYDNLTQNFSKDVLPGVGASVGLDRLIAALQHLGLTEVVHTPSKVLCVVMDEELTKEIHLVASQLRSQGISVEVYPAAAKLKKQFQYADRKGIQFVLVQGESEIADNKYTLKDMQSGEQETLDSLADLISKLSN